LVLLVTSNPTNGRGCASIDRIACAVLCFPNQQLGENDVIAGECGPGMHGEARDLIARRFANFTNTLWGKDFGGGCFYDSLVCLLLSRCKCEMSYFLATTD
jgi:hypothetical protein